LIASKVQIRFELPLTDELVTACCILLLSSEMFHAMFLDDDEPTLLDCEAIISEEFLGSLICLSLLHVVEGKLSAFATRGTTEDEAIVKGEGGGGQRQRQVSAATIRLEEKRSYQALKKITISHLDSDTATTTTTTTIEPKSKRIKF